MEKSELLKKVILAVEDEIKGLELSAGSSHQMSVDAPSAMQSHSDTTKFQMKALEENTKRSILEKQIFLRNVVDLISLQKEAKEVEIGSLVRISEGESMKQYILLEGGAGIIVEDDGKKWIVVTIASPLGKALLGKKKGEKFIFFAGGKERELEISDIE